MDIASPSEQSLLFFIFFSISSYFRPLEGSFCWCFHPVTRLTSIFCTGCREVKILVSALPPLTTVLKTFIRAFSISSPASSSPPAFSHPLQAQLLPQLCHCLPGSSLGVQCPPHTRTISGLTCPALLAPELPEKNNPRGEQWEWVMFTCLGFSTASAGICVLGKAAHISPGLIRV